MTKTRTLNADIDCAQGIVKPFLKWVGGKTQIIDDIIERFPRRVGNYHEPFVGGGSVLLAFLSCVEQGKIKLSGKVYATDLNQDLILVYQTIQTRVDEFLHELKGLQEEYRSIPRNHDVRNRNPSSLQEALESSSESYYYWIRKQFNILKRNNDTDTQLHPRRSAMFVFLNKTCFRGIHREGPNGFNVPYGNYKNVQLVDEAHIRRVAHLTRDVVFMTCPFQDTLGTRIKKGDFVYIDPPYAPEQKTSFVTYTANGFDIKEHEQLFELCHCLRKRRVKFLMSNAHVPLVTNSFPRPMYEVYILSCRRSIHSKNPGKRTDEVLITNV